MGTDRSDPVQAVLFDCDGVVLDSMAKHAQAWCRALARHGAVLQPLDVYLHEGRTVSEVARLLIEQFSSVAGAVSAETLAAEKEQLFLQDGKISVFPEVPSLLARIRKSGARLGLVTGSGRRLVETVLPASVIRLFHTVVTADDVQKCKPDPEPYLCAARRLGLHPAQCLVVENAPLGIQAARAAGMQVVGLTTTLDRRLLHAADTVAESFAELDIVMRGKLRIAASQAQDGQPKK